MPRAKKVGWTWVQVHFRDDVLALVDSEVSERNAQLPRDMWDRSGVANDLLVTHPRLRPAVRNKPVSQRRPRMALARGE